jgi:hypothetical protein
VLVLLYFAVSAPRATSAETLQDFDLDAVTVTDAYYVNATHQELTYLMSLDPDTLLGGFKAVSQRLDPSTAPNITLYGGWEASRSLIRGHTMGHFLRAMAQAYKETKLSDPTTSAQIGTTIDYIIGQLQSFQATDGYLFATTVNQFNIRKRG